MSAYEELAVTDEHHVNDGPLTGGTPFYQFDSVEFFR